MSDLNPDLISSLSSLGATGVLTLVLWLFIRGDILSRPVYERMTVTIIEQVVGEVSDAVLKTVRKMLTEWEADTVRRETAAHWETSKLKRKNQLLAEELEWGNQTIQGGDREE